jgi:hypothetical protein
MAHERKASESGAVASKGLRSPIPSAKKDDLEDVAWALSTAEAMWSRGEHSDALKWIRRAAEAASEAEADDRALELAKAAADVASLLADRPTTVAPPPPAPVVPQAPPSPVITNAASSAARPPPPIPAAGRPAGPPPIPAIPQGVTPAAPKVAVTAPALPRPVQKGPTPPRMAAPAPSKRSGRRSSPSFEEMELTKPNVVGGRRGSATNEGRKRARSSRPAPEETSQLAPLTARAPNVDAMDAWPTQSITDDDEDGEHTRIGEPAYNESAQRASARPPAPAAIPLVQSQALRVVVWRGPDGVRVAPAGTQVSAITVEAVLVALDPGTDLAAWLGNK